MGCLQSEFFKCGFCKDFIPRTQRAIGALRSMFQIYEMGFIRTEEEGQEKLSKGQYFGKASEVCISCFTNNTQELERLESEINLKYNYDKGSHSPIKTKERKKTKNLSIKAAESPPLFKSKKIK